MTAGGSNNRLGERGAMAAAILENIGGADRHFSVDLTDMRALLSELEAAVAADPAAFYLREREPEGAFTAVPLTDVAERLRAAMARAKHRDAETAETPQMIPVGVSRISMLEHKGESGERVVVCPPK